MSKQGTDKKFIKIGELARLHSVLPSTINFYTREGILKPSAFSQGGYRLYDRKRATDTLQKIDYLQRKKRLSIQEIKKVL
ncbi:MAG: MerR family transcriptional regulator [Patescibacteria group bacterium]|nr:MerR family transcriptional regulator [Patescibacteria group bacterium]MDQ5970507.1 MerR family transcriptional regulator [Patescibacteria group bacterium]